MKQLLQKIHDFEHRADRNMLTSAQVKSFYGGLFGRRIFCDGLILDVELDSRAYTILVGLYDTRTVDYAGRDDQKPYTKVELRRTCSVVFQVPLSDTRAPMIRNFKKGDALQCEGVYQEKPPYFDYVSSYFVVPHTISRISEIAAQAEVRQMQAEIDRAVKQKEEEELSRQIAAEKKDARSTIIFCACLFGVAGLFLGWLIPALFQSPSPSDLPINLIRYSLKGVAFGGLLGVFATYKTIEKHYLR